MLTICTYLKNGNSYMPPAYSLQIQKLFLISHLYSLEVLFYVQWSWFSFAPGLLPCLDLTCFASTQERRCSGFLLGLPYFTWHWLAFSFIQCKYFLKGNNNCIVQFLLFSWLVFCTIKNDLLLIPYYRVIHTFLWLESCLLIISEINKKISAFSQTLGMEAN